MSEKEQRIENIKTNMAVEGMILKDDESIVLKNILDNKISINKAIKNIIKKYKVI